VSSITFRPSRVHFNFAGNPELTFLRRHGSVFDNNFFVTANVLAAVLEADLLGMA
jgi:hypothetical protein